MAGYKWQHRIRLDPIDGAGETIVIATAMTQPNPVRTELEYEPVIDDRQDVNRRLAPRVLGYRPVATLIFQVYDLADDNQIVKIERALADDRTDVYLSLDSGTTERKVVLQSRQGPVPIEGKTVAGAEFRIRLAAVDLLTERASLASGAW